jgi:hypothetical protein
VAKFDYVVLFTVAANMVLKPTPSDTAVLVVMAVIVLGAGILFLRPLFVPTAARTLGGTVRH